MSTHTLVISRFKCIHVNKDLCTNISCRVCIMSTCKHYVTGAVLLRDAPCLANWAAAVKDSNSNSC